VRWRYGASIRQHTSAYVSIRQHTLCERYEYLRGIGRSRGMREVRVFFFVLKKNGEARGVGVALPRSTEP
jgi:hypothetical protein